jgi:excisionase family DNA binding protein
MPRRRESRAVRDVGDQAAVILLDRPLLTAEEVAALLAVPRSSVYEYARRRVDPLPSVLIGRHRRFDRRSVERWLSAQLAGSRAD